MVLRKREHSPAERPRGDIGSSAYVRWLILEVSISPKSPWRELGLTRCILQAVTYTHATANTPRNLANLNLSALENNPLEGIPRSIELDQSTFGQVLSFTYDGRVLGTSKV